MTLLHGAAVSGVFDKCRKACWIEVPNITTSRTSILTVLSTVEVLLRVNEQRNILHELRKRMANWIGHILRRNCLLQEVIEGKIKGGI
jgi:hypothetical protein